MRKKSKLMYLLSGLFLLAAVLCMILPGVRFSAALFFCLVPVPLLVVSLDLWAKKSKAGKICKRIFLVMAAFGLTVFGATECYIVAQGEADHSDLPADAVIVLGAGVNGTTPSLALQTRITAAEVYLTKHPDIPVVLSGGQGKGEKITEAEAMRRAMVKDGVDPHRLLLEECSTSTEENFSNSRELLKAHGVDPDTAAIAVVTNDFHICRARLLARREGLTTLGVPAELPWWWLSVNYYVREFFALGKMLLF